MVRGMTSRRIQSVDWPKPNIKKITQLGFVFSVLKGLTELSGSMSASSRPKEDIELETGLDPLAVEGVRMGGGVRGGGVWGVYAGTLKEGGLEVAVKIRSKPGASLDEDVAFLRRLAGGPGQTACSSLPCLVQIYTLSMQGGFRVRTDEMGGRVDAFAMAPLGDSHAWGGEFFLQDALGLISAVERLHMCGFVHRAIRPEVIVVPVSEGANAVLIDLSACVERGKQPSPFAGPLHFASGTLLALLDQSSEVVVQEADDWISLFYCLLALKEPRFHAAIRTLDPPISPYCEYVRARRKSVVRFFAKRERKSGDAFLRSPTAKSLRRYCRNYLTEH